MSQKPASHRSPEKEQPFYLHKNRLPLLRETLLALILFGAAYWSMDSLNLFELIIESSRLFPDWRVQQVIPALIVSLLGYIALVLARVHFINVNLQASEQQLRFFVEHTPVAIAMFDEQMCLLECSLRWRLDLVLSSGGLRGRSLAELLPTMPKGWLNLPGVCLRGEVIQGVEESFQLVNGQEEWILWSAHPCHRVSERDGIERIGGVILFAELITLRKQAEAQVRAREAAEAASEAKSLFLAVMSHEIRTPLTGTMGMVDQLSSTDLDARQRQQVELLQRSNEALLAIINNILDFSKIEAGKMELEAIPFQPGQLLSDIESLFGHSTRQKGVGFRLRVDSRLPVWLVGDPVRLRQIVMNLLSNALKFTEQGEIGLEVVVTAQDSVGCQLLLTIHDTGVGMTEAQLGSLFATYTQADASISRHYGGTGLGLAICRQLTELMQGRISVKSQLGQGSAFLVELPFVLASAEQRIKPTTVGAPMVLAPLTKSGRVLVVDDDLLSRQLAEVMLQHWSVEVMTVSGGMEALAALKKIAFDLIFLDIQMPGMNGYETCQEIRAYECAQGVAMTPVIALSGNVLPAGKQRGQAAGMSDFLEKPLRVQALQGILHRWLPDLSVTESEVMSTDSFSAVDVETHAESAEIPLLNLQTLEVLRSELARVPGAFANILGLFISDVMEKLSTLQRALDAHDEEVVIRLAHSMKSQCGSVGAERLRALFIQMEQVAKAGRLGEAAQLFVQVSEIFQRICPDLEFVLSSSDIPITAERLYARRSCA